MKKKEKAINPEVQNNEEEIQVVQEESTGKRILNSVVNFLLVAAIVLAAMCTYVSYVSTSGSGVPSLFGIRIFSIQTESMYPTLLPGDMIFDTAVKDTSALRKGDIITYWTVINGERVLNTHRIEEIYDGGGYLIFSTKGDNNNTTDALTVHESEIVGKYSFRVGSLGKVFDYLQTSTGFLIVVVIPVFLFFLLHLVQFFRVLFEYQNVKNRIKYEQERGRTEDLIEEQERKQKERQAQARAAMEAELREKLKAELMATMVPQTQGEPEKENEPAKEPEAMPEVKNADTWDCECGNKGITGKFCGECGAKKPEAPETWDCACGNKGITGKFCGECGAKKPDPAEEAHAEEPAVEVVPVEEVPAEETPAVEIPVEEVPAEETPAVEVPVEEAPAEETPAVEVPVEEVPAEEVPAEESPAEETPADEVSAEEVPVEEPAAEEAPAGV